MFRVGVNRLWPVLPVMTEANLVGVCAMITNTDDAHTLSEELKKYQITREYKKIIADLVFAKYLSLHQPECVNQLFPDLKFRHSYERHENIPGFEWIALAAGLGHVEAFGMGVRGGCHSECQVELHEYELPYRNFGDKRNLKQTHEAQGAMFTSATSMSYRQLIIVLAYIKNINYQSSLDNFIIDVLDMCISCQQQIEIGKALYLRLLKLVNNDDEITMQHIHKADTHLSKIHRNPLLLQLLQIAASFRNPEAIHICHQIGVDVPYAQSFFNVLVDVEDDDERKCFSLSNK